VNHFLKTVESIDKYDIFEANIYVPEIIFIDIETWRLEGTWLHDGMKLWANLFDFLSEYCLVLKKRMHRNQIKTIHIILYFCCAHCCIITEKNVVLYRPAVIKLHGEESMILMEVFDSRYIFFTLSLGCCFLFRITFEFC